LKKINQIEPHMDDDEKKELVSVINSGWFTEASKTRQFEKMFADFVGVKYACAVTSGTTALYVGLKALGIGSGRSRLLGGKDTERGGSIFRALHAGSGRRLPGRS